MCAVNVSLCTFFMPMLAFRPQAVIHPKIIFPLFDPVALMCPIPARLCLRDGERSLCAFEFCMFIKVTNVVLLFFIRMLYLEILENAEKVKTRAKQFKNNKITF